MSSKAFVFLGLLLTFVLLLSSQLAARDLGETSSSKKDNETTVKTNGAEDAKYGGQNDRIYSGGGGYRRGGYGRDDYGLGGYGGFYGRGCQYGPCVYRCCRYAGEVVEAAKP